MKIDQKKVTKVEMYHKNAKKVEIDQKKVEIDQKKVETERFSVVCSSPNESESDNKIKMLRSKKAEKMKIDQKKVKKVDNSWVIYMLDVVIQLESAIRFQILIEKQIVNDYPAAKKQLLRDIRRERVYRFAAEEIQKELLSNKLLDNLRDNEKIKMYTKKHFDADRFFNNQFFQEVSTLLVDNLIVGRGYLVIGLSLWIKSLMDFYPFVLLKQFSASFGRLSRLDGRPMAYRYYRGPFSIFQMSKRFAEGITEAMINCGLLTYNSAGKNGDLELKWEGCNLELEIRYLRKECLNYSWLMIASPLNWKFEKFQEGWKGVDGGSFSFHHKLVKSVKELLTDEINSKYIEYKFYKEFYKIEEFYKAEDDSSELYKKFYKGDSGYRFVFGENLNGRNFDFNLEEEDPRGDFKKKFATKLHFNSNSNARNDVVNFLKERFNDQIHEDYFARGFNRVNKYYLRSKLRISSDAEMNRLLQVGKSNRLNNHSLLFKKRAEYLNGYQKVPNKINCKFVKFVIDKKKNLGLSEETVESLEDFITSFKRDEKLYCILRLNPKGGILSYKEKNVQLEAIKQAAMLPLPCLEEEGVGCLEEEEDDRFVIENRKDFDKRLVRGFLGGLGWLEISNWILLNGGKPDQMCVNIKSSTSIFQIAGIVTEDARLCEMTNLCEGPLGERTSYDIFKAIQYEIKKKVLNVAFLNIIGKKWDINSSELKILMETSGLDRLTDDENIKQNTINVFYGSKDEKVDKRVIEQIKETLSPSENEGEYEEKKESFLQEVIREYCKCLEKTTRKKGKKLRGLLESYSKLCLWLNLPIIFENSGYVTKINYLTKEQENTHLMVKGTKVKGFVYKEVDKKDKRKIRLNVFGDYMDFLEATICHNIVEKVIANGCGGIRVIEPNNFVVTFRNKQKLMDSYKEGLLACCSIHEENLISWVRHINYSAAHCLYKGPIKTLEEACFALEKISKKNDSSYFDDWNDRDLREARLYDLDLKSKRELAKMLVYYKNLLKKKGERKKLIEKIKNSKSKNMLTITGYLGAI